MNPQIQLFLLSAALAAAPAFAQEGGDVPAPAPANPAKDLEPIAADGFQAFIDLMEQFAKDQIEKLPSGDKSPRENAYGKLAVIQLAGASAALALPAAGTALGGGIGLCVDLSTAGADVGAGTIVGSSIGLGSGIVVGTGAFVTSLLATLPLVDEIEARYPPEQGAGAGGQFLVVRGAAATGGGAGLMESFYVNLVSALPDQFVTVVEQWDRTPGLGAAEKNWLRGAAFARPQLQRLAWIKRNQRVSAAAGRASDLFLDVGRVLSGDAVAIERAWLAALGLGSTGLAVANEKLVLEVPPTLRAFGLPAKLQANVPGFAVKVGGNGGALDPYLRLKLEVGPFDVDWGTVEVVKSGADKNLIAVSFGIAKGSRLGAAKLFLRAGGDETKIVDLHPALDRALGGTLFFRLDGLALAFVKARIGNLDVAFGLPKEIRDLPVVKDLLAALGSAFEHDLKEFLRDNVPFGRLFDGFGQGAGSALARSVQLTAGHHGLAGITRVTAAEIANGVVRVHVRGRELRQPKLAGDLAEAQRAWRGLGTAQVRKGAPRPLGRSGRR
ncbi:MAG: hypothetical protein U1E73_13010 [Planctomycetota bacterium]